MMGSKSKYLICRLCLSYGEVLVDICESEAEPGFEVKETIEDLLRVEVVPGGDLPWLVCLNCISKLEDFSNFKFKCISSNSAFVQRFTKQRQSAATGIHTQTSESSSGGSRGGGGSVPERRVCEVDSSQRVVVVAVSPGSFVGTDSDPAHNGRTMGQFPGDSEVTPQGSSVPSEVSKGTTTTFKPHPVAISERLPGSIKMEDEDPMVTGCPLRQMGSGIVIVSTTSAASSSSEGGKAALYLKADDPREVVQSELDDEEDEEDEEDRKEGIFISTAFEHDATSGEGSATTGCTVSASATNLCPPQTATRLVVYSGGVEGGGKKRLLGEEDTDTEMEQRELRIDKITSAREMRSRGGLSDPPPDVMRETPLERKRRMARERQRRFRARQSSEMAWRRAQDRPQLCKRHQWAYGQLATNSGDEASPGDKADPDAKLAYQLKL